VGWPSDDQPRGARTPKEFGATKQRYPEGARRGEMWPQLIPRSFKENQDDLLKPGAQQRVLCVHLCQCENVHANGEIGQ
jgi:hypothetical protein